MCKASIYILIYTLLRYFLFKKSVRSRRHKQEEGFAIVLVMWSLILLGLVSANLLRQARTTHYIFSTDLARLQAQAVADGAINLVIQNLLNPLASAPLSLNGEFTNILVVNKDVSVKVEDEAGKIDINTANFPLLSALVRDAGASSSEADFIAKNVILWRLSQNAASRGDSDKAYVDAGRLYGPRHGPFRAVPELRLVLGMTDPIQAAVAPLVTIWSDHAGIDRDAASDTVLGVLATAGDSLAVSEKQKRRSGADISTNRKPVLNHTFSVVARVASAGVDVERHAVVRLVAARRKPYVILDWS